MNTDWWDHAKLTIPITDRLVHVIVKGNAGPRLYMGIGHCKAEVDSESGFAIQPEWTVVRWRDDPPDLAAGESAEVVGWREISWPEWPEDDDNGR